MSITPRVSEDIPSARLNDCLAVVSGAQQPTLHPDAITEVTIQTGGLFNFLLRVVVGGNVYFFKQYLDNQENATFSNIPKSPAADRAELAYQVQREAHEANTGHGQLVPRIVHFDRNRNAFLMEPALGDATLIESLKSGFLPPTAVTDLPRTLGRLHQATYGKYDTTTLYANTVFRDFKLDIQYDKIADLLEPDEAAIVRRTKAEYQDRRVCVTHGDPNSLNVMIGHDEMGLYDFEQSHLGGPEYDLAYLLCEMWIAMEYFGRRLEHKVAIARFLDNYFEEFTAESRHAIEAATTNHLATQIIYRFLGPSRATWTSHIPETNQPAIIDVAKSMLDNDPRPITAILEQP